MYFYKLSEPFPVEDIEWRIQSVGKTKQGNVYAQVFAYVTNRAIMQRLDEVVGCGNWKNEYKEWIDKSVLCGLSIHYGNEWITKWDGAEQTDFEAVKGGLSSAMKRAAVQWGIGRYLYQLEPQFAKIKPDGKYWQKGKNGEYEAFKWDAPELPSWALPKKEINIDDFILKIISAQNMNQLKEYFEEITKNPDIKNNKKYLDKIVEEKEKRKEILSR